MVKFLGIFLLLVQVWTPVAAQTEALEPLERWEKKKPNWASDVSEVGYVGVRCGALFGVLGAVFRDRAAKPGDSEMGSQVTARGVALLTVGNRFSEQSGWSKERLQARTDAIAKSYIRTVTDNRTVHNNMFHGFIEQDWRFCLQFEKMLKEIASK